jgi:hypothetical protein
MPRKTSARQRRRSLWRVACAGLGNGFARRRFNVGLNALRCDKVAIATGFDWRRSRKLVFSDPSLQAAGTAPKIDRDRDGVDTPVLPPAGFIAMAMDFVVMQAAKRDGILIA